MKKTSTKTNLIIVFFALAVSEILLSIYPISTIYGKMFLSKVAANVFLALFEIIFIYGILDAAITFILAYILFKIVRKSTDELERQGFILNIMLFNMIDNLVCAVLYAFSFLDARIYVFLEYICPIAVNGIAFILMTHLVFLKKVTKNRQGTFLNLILPYFAIKALGYFSNMILYLSQDTFGDKIKELGFALTFDPNEKTALIIGAALLGAYAVYIAVAYYLLSKKPTSGGGKSNEISGTVEDDTKVFDDFDI